ncbi:hypothetical protein M918_21655 [Clostridium sp. BL8]|nr:hypothetical protein M918_21655 [Clostridium sp. BL8]
MKIYLIYSQVHPSLKALREQGNSSTELSFNFGYLYLEVGEYYNGIHL